MKRFWLPRLTTGVSRYGCWGEGLLHYLDFVLYLLKRKKKKKKVLNLIPIMAKYHCSIICPFYPDANHIPDDKQSKK